jgi:hypothetical protein
MPFMLTKQYEQFITDTHIVKAVELARSNTINMTVDISTGGTAEETEQVIEAALKDCKDVLKRTLDKKRYFEKINQ